MPKVMGHSLRLHPLLVIFGLLAGGEIYGFPGILVALPLLAAARAVWEFFAERVALRALARGRSRSPRPSGSRSSPTSRRAPLAAVSRAAPARARRRAALRRRRGARADGLRARRGRDGRARRSERRREVDAARDPRRRARAERRLVEAHAPSAGCRSGPRTTRGSRARENLELFARLEGVRDRRAAARDLLDRFSLPAGRSGRRASSRSATASG